MQKKLAVITTHPIQVQAPLWRELAQTGKVDLLVYFGSDFSLRGYLDRNFNTFFSWDIPLVEGYPHTFLSTDPHISSPEELHLNMAELRRRLREFSPDFALILGYSPPAFYLKAFLVLRLLGIPILMRSPTMEESYGKSKVKLLLRYCFLRIFYSQIAKFLAVGQVSRQHYLSKGVPESKLYYSPYNADTGHLENQVQQWLPQRQEIRAELGFKPDDFVFIYSGKIIPPKDPLLIPAAFREMPGKSRAGVGLIVMGDGSLRPQLETEMRSIQGVPAVFVGFQNQSRIGRFYAAADCLLLPSRWGETWGLVVNDALQFGLPVLVSDRAGCHPDLVVEGETGLVFPGGEAGALAERMDRIMALSASRGAALKDACRQKAQTHSVENAVAGILTALA